MTRAFGQFARKERIEDRMLCEAIERAERGIVDADLGGGVIKWRGRGKGVRAAASSRGGKAAEVAAMLAAGKWAEIKRDA